MTSNLQDCLILTSSEGVHTSAREIAELLAEALPGLAQNSAGLALAKRNTQLSAANALIAEQKAEIKSLTAALTDANDRLGRNAQSAFKQIQESNARETQLENALRAAGVEVPSVLDLDEQAVSS